MTARLSIHPARRLEGPRAVPLLIFIAILGSEPLGAQYTSPGTAVSTSAIPAEETLERNMNDAAWNLGRVRLSPWIGLRDAALVTTRTGGTGASTSDFTATVGAGLRAYLPTGKAVWSAHVLPEYVWWQDDDAKSQLNGRFGLGLFGFFNRLTLEASLSRVEAQEFFSSEIQELTSSRSDTARLGVEVEIARRLTVFVVAEREDLANEENTSEIFPLLDREEERVTTGVLYRSPKDWTLGLGYEDSSASFAEGARNLSNSGSATLFDLGYEGSRIGFRLALAERDLEADEGSDFGRFTETTGSLEALLSPSAKMSLLTYARRRQTFSVDFQNAFGIEDRQGVRLDYSLPRTALGFYGEIGSDEFEAVGGGTRRLDDVTALGLDVRITLGRLAQLTVYLTQTNYDSSDAAFDRDITDLRFSLELRSLTRKLSLGQPGGDW